MRLIGIYIHKETHPLVRKNLVPDYWYPFIQTFVKPITDERCYRKYSRKSETNPNVYQVFKDLPRQISICCICGMNGSGKSTLLDILYRILNNFSLEIMKKQTVFFNDLVLAEGLYADLYFEVEDKNGKTEPAYISCKEDQTSLFMGFKDGKWNEVLFPMDKENYVRNILSSFFYTIVTNYSVYSLNKKDYEPDSLSDYCNCGINGEWLDKLFNKNDGYFTPISVAPYRKSGVFDVKREKTLAYQRLITLTLFFYSKGRRFIDGYEAQKLRYKYNPQYKFKIQQELYNKLEQEGLERKKIDLMIKAFRHKWETRYGLLILRVCQTDDERDSVLFYLSAKSLRICLTYPTFRNIFNPHEVGNMKISSQQIEELADKTITKILSTDEQSHITTKIRRCIKFIESGLYRMASEVSEISCDVLCKNRFSSYIEASETLPPPFFEMELVLSKRRRSSNSAYFISDKSEITFSRMSSGELQFLFCMSNILYHLKNIQSVVNDKYRVKYHHINLIFDEAELYSHPDLQRRFVKMLLESLNNADVDRRSIYSINIIIATHSPFILSDVQGGNILYLDNGAPSFRHLQTFGANLYDLMKDSFFFRTSAMGEIAEQTIGKLVQQVNRGENTDKSIERIIGDSAILGYLKYRRRQNVQDSEIQG